MLSKWLKTGELTAMLQESAYARIIHKEELDIVEVPERDDAEVRRDLEEKRLLFREVNRKLRAASFEIVIGFKDEPQWCQTALRILSLQYVTIELRACHQFPARSLGMIGALAVPEAGGSSGSVLIDHGHGSRMTRRGTLANPASAISVDGESIASRRGFCIAGPRAQHTRCSTRSAQ